VAEFGYMDNFQTEIDRWIANCGGGGRARKGDILMDRMVITDYAYFHKPELLEG
jgi:AAA+ superfamily predicted ATPase